jgi:BASS family bile acid:Na+ symporter
MNLLQVTQKVLVIAFLLSSMVGVGLTLTGKTLITPLRKLRFVLLALALNFVIAPALASLLTRFIPLEQGYASALLLLSLAAGAPFLPKLVDAAHGDVSLGVALMALLTVATIVVMPLALPILIPGLYATGWSIARPLLIMILLPLITGMLINEGLPRVAARFAAPLKFVGNVSLLLLFILLVVANIPALMGVLGSRVILVAILYVLGLFVSAWITGGADARGVLALATSARNFGAALVPAASSLNDPKVTIALIVNAIVGLIVAFAAAAWVRRRSGRFTPALA